MCADSLGCKFFAKIERPIRLLNEKNWKGIIMISVRDDTKYDVGSTDDYFYFSSGSLLKSALDTNCSNNM